MKKLLTYIKETLPTLVMLYGLGLVVDNWGHNHDLLVLPGSILFTHGLGWEITRIVKEVSHD